MSILTPLTIDGQNDFDHALETPLQAASLKTIQINIGLTCNLACHHCHVTSSPKRTEQMDWPTLEHVLRAAHEVNARTIDITGGAPEMNPYFRRFITAARAADHEVMVRTNLTIMLHEGYETMPEFYRDHRVHLVASLPCYLKENVNKQRGMHVYEDSIEVIQKLNALGYGRCDTLPLDLVYNPLGPYLPPAQPALEADYKRELKQRFDIDFTTLYTITNMPIGRYLHDLERDGQAEDYLTMLRNAYNPATVDELMCRHQIHVSYDGTLHDCDFNYALAMPVRESYPQHISEFDAEALRERRIATGAHCFGCTAGHGSSCTGALA